MPSDASAGALPAPPPVELREAARHAWAEPDPTRKAALARALAEAAAAGRQPLDTQARLLAPAERPGQPERPRLVPPKDVPQRALSTPAGRAALLHAIAHIEFNAINLALDAAWRFPGLPPAFYRDWLRVAGEEALHFSLLVEHLAALGTAYGDFDAHDGLWRMTAATAHDPLARMALVPRTLEARGLDATPPLQAKLARAGDAGAVAILDVILRDEIGHVAVGNRWYRHLCALQGLDPVSTYPTLVARYKAPRLRGPFNFEARGAAGFSAEELDALATGAGADAGAAGG
ncbi:ferritin-like domain-containing protein [Aquariibacter albus]|uniref:Ferritin-like domain-containing protein n=1 Tax=Aquariibacter albus TaxID=2759899 RepID=A0A839HP45_9BURK|nr:ferritin-like domain-containing protein [Aquariibacter albus]MBB1161079.1 ferritin-like domain-containing protein [Aquariibacter albus]